MLIGEMRKMEDLYNKDCEHIILNQNGIIKEYDIKISKGLKNDDSYDNDKETMTIVDYILTIGILIISIVVLILNSLAY